MIKSVEEKTFANAAFHIVFDEKRISEFLISQFIRIRHVLVKKRVVFGIGGIVKPQA